MPDIYDYLKELAKIEIEFKDEHGKYFCLNSYVKSLDNDRILINAPNYGGETYNLAEKQPVNIVICGESGAYIAESYVIGKELSTTPGVWVSYPYSSYLVQRREYQRTDLQLNAEITVFEDSSRQKIKKIKVKTRDLSAKGFSYISKEPLNNYYDIECKIYLDDKGTKYIKAKCEHIYSDKSKNNPENVYINAFAFIDLNPDDLDSLVKLCFKHKLNIRN